MPSSRAIDEAIAAIYAAALDPAGWTQALGAISACLDSAAACVFLTENATQQVPHWAAIGLDDGAAEYREHYVAIDPRRHYALANPQTRIHYDHMLIDERGMDRNEFYAWQEKYDGFRYFLGCRIDVDRDHTGYAAFHWPRRKGHVQAPAIRLFTRLAPHIERALQVGCRLSDAGRSAAVASSILENSWHGVVLLRRDGSVMSLNRAAEAIVTANDGLALRDRRLTAARADEDARLQMIVSGAARVPPDAGGVVAISRASGRRSYAVLAACLPQEHSPFATGVAAIAVFITDPEQRRELPEEALIRLYRLTRAEAAMAVRIVAGMSLKQAAGDLDIAATTARLHLQRVLEKTGTHRQSDLVRLLLTTVPPGISNFQ